METVCMLIFINKNTIVYFDSFRVDNISQEVLNKITADPSLTTYLNARCQFFCICVFFYCFHGIYDGGKSFVKSYQFIFSPSEYKKNDKMIYRYSEETYGKLKRKP